MINLNEYPELLKEYDLSNNYDITSLVSRSRIKWICKNNHKWEAIVYSRIKGHGCPYCTRVKISKEDSIIYSNLLKEWDYDKNIIDPECISSGSYKKVWWKCKFGHSWEKSVKHRKNSNCPYCNGRKVGYGNSLKDLYPTLSKEWDEKNFKPDSVRPGSHKVVHWKCKNNHKWIAKIKDRVRGRGCSLCSKRISKSGKKWIESIGIIQTEVYININNKKFFVDGFDKTNNIIYEYFGYFWHGHPDKYNRNDKHPIIGKTFGELYDNTIKKLKIFEDAGFKVVYKWGK